METTPRFSGASAPRFATTHTLVGNRPMPMQRPLPKRLLGVWAHPDDEAYLSAGLMARVIEAGGSVTILTATAGEKGTADPALYDSDEFAAFRRAELVASVAELGVTDVRFMGVRDGECDVADDDAHIRAVRDVIDEVGPDTIVTFGPDGITGHPDHRTVSRWTTRAWNQTDQAAALLYAAMTKDFLARHAELHERLGVFEEYGRKPASIVTCDVALGCRLTASELERKRRALARHASQTVGLADIVGEETYLRWWVDETFRSATACDGARRSRSADAHQLVGAR
jgi:LmbE family N-acetylglucosaminyl deacetylase